MLGYGQKAVISMGAALFPVILNFKEEFKALLLDQAVPNIKVTPSDKISSPSMSQHRPG
jgi:hypothetical protein